MIPVIAYVDGSAEALLMKDPVLRHHQIIHRVGDAGGLIGQPPQHSLSETEH